MSNKGSRFPGNVIENLLLKGLGALLGLLLGLLFTRFLPFLFREGLPALAEVVGALFRALVELSAAVVERSVTLAEFISGRSLRHSPVAAALAAGGVLALVVVPGVVGGLVALGALVELLAVVVYGETFTSLTVVGLSFVVGTLGGFLWAAASPRRADAPQRLPTGQPAVLSPQAAMATGSVREGLPAVDESESEDEYHPQGGVAEGLVVGEVQEPWW